MHRIGLTFSFFAICALCWAGPYARLDAQTRRTSDPKQIAKEVLAAVPEDDNLVHLAKSVKTSSGKQQSYFTDLIRSEIRVSAAAEQMGSDNSAISQVKAIKRSPLYRDERVESANWFASAGTALGNMLNRLLSFQFPQAKPFNPNFPNFLGNWLIYAMWAILAVLLGVLAYIAFRHARWRRNLRRKATAMLEEDEPERTLDEWLERANELEQAGQYREAVRCLYLACLLKFDEARVAKFDRGQTNWEHLARIQASPLLPPGLDFEMTTKAFDQIWYGMRTKGKDDVVQFRAWYLYVTESLMAKAA